MKKDDENGHPRWSATQIESVQNNTKKGYGSVDDHTVSRNRMIAKYHTEKSRVYGSGHDMVSHGEGKAHGE